MRMILAVAAVSLLAAPAFAAEPVPDTAAPVQPAAAPAAVPVVSVIPAGATGRCKDGTYTMVHHYSGACSSNKGVAKWF